MGCQAEDVVYVVDYADYAHDVEVESELDANAQNFAQQLTATVTSISRRQVTRRRGVGPLPGLDFAVVGSAVPGAGLAVVDGRRVYVAAAVSVKPHDRRPEIDRFSSPSS